MRCDQAPGNNLGNGLFKTDCKLQVAPVTKCCRLGTVKVPHNLKDVSRDCSFVSVVFGPLFSSSSSRFNSISSVRGEAKSLLRASVSCLFHFPRKQGNAGETFLVQCRSVLAFTSWTHLNALFSFGSVTGGQGVLRNKCHHHHETFSFLDFIILDGLLRIAQNEPTTSAVYSFSTLLNCCSMKNCSYETRICRVLICVVPLHFLACSASFIIY